ncbi:MAG TPA: histidine triad nucleotide-binding protein [Acidimicrobiales bacterium]|nr:histidine triad nucleotide-binding protein [Acidimicrobiales bacterium]
MSEPQGSDAPDRSDCLFCRIVDEALPADIVRTSERTVAFRDLNPTAPTHVLVVPRQHVAHAGEVGAEHAELVAELLTTARQVAEDDGIDASGYRLVLNVGDDSGNTVPHLHLHVIGGRRLGWPPG